MTDLTHCKGFHCWNLRGAEVPGPFWAPRRPRPFNLWSEEPQRHNFSNLAMITLQKRMVGWVGTSVVWSSLSDVWILCHFWLKIQPSLKFCSPFAINNKMYQHVVDILFLKKRFFHLNRSRYLNRGSSVVGRRAAWRLLSWLGAETQSSLGQERAGRVTVGGSKL